MKILFVVFDYLATPLGVLYLSKIARNAGHQVDVGAIHLSSFMKDAIEYKPDIVAYSLITGAHQQFLDVNRKLKEHIDFLGIFGGPHCTFFPDVINEKGVDAISRGESEEAFAEFISAVEEGKSPDNISNWWIKKNGNIIQNYPHQITTGFE